LIDYNLTEREKEVFTKIVETYIESANTVSSKFLNQLNTLGCSSATLRNTMHSLEEKGLLVKKHISGGRIPTEMGYRYYVNSLMAPAKFSLDTSTWIYKELTNIHGDLQAVLKQTSRLLAAITEQLGLVFSPKFTEGVLERIELIRLSSESLLLVLSIRAGLTKTLRLQITSEISDKDIEYAKSIISERLCGLTIETILKEGQERLTGISKANQELLNAVLDGTNYIFGIADEVLFVYGMERILKNPEFSSGDLSHSLLKLLDGDTKLNHIFQRTQNGIVVRIGSELNDPELQSFSIVSAPYSIGHATGNIGVIGLIRMPYNIVISSLSLMSNIMEELMG
jgi:heat-inducible transcriptional repressor